ncbi:hypothetical protein [Microbacterium binotii]|uniref:hypothetical protein n=1 Tax=Microbacterium binotii TaxID=462710 RepID=UPI001F490B3E|nr:hypothetical protein [Microbacterium binotii]UIN30920.1 hypothetical protein LXM64_01555 [Microbacterium binotii]
MTSLDATARAVDARDASDIARSITNEPAAQLRLRAAVAAHDNALCRAIAAIAAERGWTNVRWTPERKLAMSNRDAPPFEGTQDPYHQVTEAIAEAEDRERDDHTADEIAAMVLGR